MNKTILTLAALLVLATAGSAAAGKLRVVTSLPNLGAIAREIGGERLSVESISRPDQDPHRITAKPSDMLALRKADLFVVAGLDLEIGWAPLLQQGSRNRKVQVGAPGFVDASAHVVPLEVPTVVSRASGDVHPGGNPHYWLDPANAEPVARAILEGLVRVDPEGAEDYRRGFESFVRRAQEATAAWTERLAGLRGTRVVSYHRTWPYLERRFGLECVGQLEPKPGIPPSPRHLAELQETIASQGVQLVLRAPYEPERPVERLAERTGARDLVLPTEPGASGTGMSWFELFDAIVGRLQAAASAPGHGS